MLDVDFLGDGSWVRYRVVEVEPGGYFHYEFPDSFGAHWIRASVHHDCEATLYFHYR